jgi:translation initiation factor 1
MFERTASDLDSLHNWGSEFSEMKLRKFKRMVRKFIFLMCVFRHVGDRLKIQPQKPATNNFTVINNSKIRMTKKKERLNVVYSTNPNYAYEFEETDSPITLPKNQQKLYVSIDRKQRAGKEVTLIEGFIGSDEDFKTLAKLLKNKCGVGGSAKDGEILVQGNFRDKIIELLLKEGYQVKRKGG